MKTFLKFLGTLAIIAIVAVVVLHFLMPYIGEDWNSFFDNLKSLSTTTDTKDKTPNDPNDPNGPDDTNNTPVDGTEKDPTDSAPDSSEKEPEIQQPDGTVAVTVTVFKQDPESGDYKTAQTVKVYPKEGEAYTYTPETLLYYTLNTAKSTLSLASAIDGAALAVYYDCETYTVTFNGGEDSECVAGELTQTLRKGQTPVAPTFSRYGYTCVGFDVELAPLYSDTTINAIWQISRYTVTLLIPDNTTLSDSPFTPKADAPSYFEATFTVFDTLTLPTPSGQDINFIAWNTASDGSGTVYTEITDLQKDLTLYAIFSVVHYTVSFAEVEGVSYPAYYLPAGAKISSPYIAPANQKAGYGLVWYTDAACTNAYNFNKMPAKNITLYGKWVLDTGTGFLDWNLEDIANETVDSFEELVMFVDYVRFYNILEPVEIEVTYATYEAVIEDLGRVDDYEEFRANGSVNFSSFTKKSYRHEGAKCAITVDVGNSYRDVEATKTTDSCGIVNRPYLTESVIPRGESYTKFYIDSLPKSFPVTTTNQLQYVVEHGYKPMPVAGSSAETIYRKAKALLNAILPADATDLEKLELIFLYLTTNVEYDNNAVAAGNQSPNSWPLYDAFFMEGVFNNQKAVCDGIAKALSLLCNIEGIPAVEITGTAHAWNRVFVNNRWYVVDATYGNLQITPSMCSVTDHSYFMTTDADKTADGNDSNNYPRIVADTEYDYFDSKEFTLRGTTYDFVITSTEEFAAMLEYLLTLKDDLEGYTVDFVYEISGTSLASSYQRATQLLSRRGVRFNYSTSTVGGSYGEVVKLIFS